MVIIYLFRWWYSQGWIWLIKQFMNSLNSVNDAFSIPTLLRTWFSPWKQIQTETTFRNFIQSSIDNLISRFVGATVRTGMIIGAILASCCILVGVIIGLIIWPFLPLGAVILTALYLSGASG